MGDAAAAPWGSGPMYRPPDARPEWEEPVRRPAPERTLTVVRRPTLRIDAERAEDKLSDVGVAQARRALALRRRLNRATAQAARAVEVRQQRAAERAAQAQIAEAAEARARVEQERIAAMAQLEAARAAADERLRVRAAAVEAERLAAAARARADATRAAQAQIADRERQAVLDAAREDAQQRERARLAALHQAEVEERQREAAWAAQLADEDRRADGRQRLVLANTLERSAAFLRDYEAWARSRGLRVVDAAGLATEADRLGRYVDELRYG